MPQRSAPSHPLPAEKKRTKSTTTNYILCSRENTESLKNIKLRVNGKIAK